MLSRRQEALVLQVLGTPKEILVRHGVAVRGRRARCPLHDDRHPSLFVYTNRHGDPRWVCYAGCGRGDALMLESKLSRRPIRAVLDECLCRVGGTGAGE